MGIRRFHSTILLVVMLGTPFFTGIVSGAILQLRAEYQLDCLEQEMVVSSMLMGAVVASLTGGTGWHTMPIFFTITTQHLEPNTVVSCLPLSRHYFVAVAYPINVQYTCKLKCISMSDFAASFKP